jgi:hypothetical protein
MMPLTRRAPIVGECNWYQESPLNIAVNPPTASGIHTS